MRIQHSTDYSNSNTGQILAPEKDKHDRLMNQYINVQNSSQEGAVFGIFLADE